MIHCKHLCIDPCGQYIIPKKLIHNHRKYRKYKSTLFYTTIQKETNNKTKLKTMIHEKPNCNTKKKKFQPEKIKKRKLN